MASASQKQLLSEEIQCSICLDVFLDPVSTPCGHSYCKRCLTDCWNHTRKYTCPYCKENFSQRPELKINIALKQVVQLLQAEGADPPPETESEVLCDICDGVKKKATKTCLVCLNAFCETHLEPHQRVAILKKHKLVDPMQNLCNYLCRKHEKPLELFCQDDLACICLQCCVLDHNNHKVVGLEEACGVRKPHLRNMKTVMQQMIKERAKRIQDMKHSVKLRRETSEKEKAANITLFADLIRSIERCQSELLEIMEQKQKAAEQQFDELIKELEHELSDLRKRESELEQVSDSGDELHLLKMYPVLSRAPQTKNWSRVSILNTELNVETLRTSLTKLQETLEENIRKTALERIQSYAVVLTLDPETAHPILILTEDGKQVTYGTINLKVPFNPKRFDTCGTVLTKECFSSGRFYFEVQVKGKTKWDLGVAIESVNRKGLISVCPETGYWSIMLRDGHHYEARDSPPVSLSLRFKPQLIGVFVDYEEGLVSFYDVKQKFHLYSFTGQKFSQKLFPFLSPCSTEKGKNAAPLIITNVR